MQTQPIRIAPVDNESDSASAPGVPVQEYWQILRRRRLIIIQAFLVVAVVGIIITLLTKSVYQATAQLLVDGQSFSINTVDDSNPLSGILALSQEQDVATQVEELQAAPLMDKVLKDVGPATITVDELKETNVIEVTAESTNKNTAANAANDLLNTYIADDVDRNLNEIRSAESFAQKQEVAAHQRLATSEAQLRAFKLQNSLPDLTQDRTQEIADVDAANQLVQKDQASLSALRAQISASQQLLTGEPAAISVTLPSSNPQLISIQNQIATLQLQRIALTQKGGFTAKAPQIVAIDAQLASLNKQLTMQPQITSTVASTPNATRENLRASIVTMRGQLAAQTAQAYIDQSNLMALKAKSGKFADWEVKLDDLQREHDTAQTDDAMFSQKIAELSLREQAHHASAHIIQPAVVPTVPVRPQRVMSILFSCVMGLFVGIGLALLQEFLDDRVNSVDEATRVLGIPSLGQIPVITGGGPRLLSEMGALTTAAECYRILRTNLYFSSVDAPITTLLVTSSGPGEGKTTTAINLALAMALDGKRVILVDTDLRRPSMHKVLEIANVPGLTDVLLGHATLEDVMQVHKSYSSLSILPGGSTPPNPGELLNSRKFRNLVEELQSQADIVIFDSSPVLVAADSAILASQLDGTLFVVESGETKKASAKRAIDILRKARATILGIGYNKLTAESHEGYYYNHYSYYALDAEGPNDAKNGHKPAKRLAKPASDASGDTIVVEDDHAE